MPGSKAGALLAAVVSAAFAAPDLRPAPPRRPRLRPFDDFVVELDDVELDVAGLDVAGLDVAGLDVVLAAGAFRGARDLPSVFFSVVDSLSEALLTAGVLCSEVDSLFAALLA